MSNAIFPVLPGLKWDTAKVPRFSTKVQTAASGKESRAAYWSYPKWEFKLSYELLRGANGFTELQTLLGFFLQRQGSFDTFLYQDPSDYLVTGQQLGTGDGVTAKFQLIRTMGGFVEPMQNINGAPVVKLDGVTQVSGWSVDSTGIITFAVAPGAGVAITADFSFYFRCRFIRDESEFSQFMHDLWELKKCEMVTVK